MWITFTIIALVSVLTSIVEAQDFESPCPRLFVYEKKSAEPNKWYGIITVLTETDLSGLWLRIIFDEPPLQIGNWFGSVEKKEDGEYLIKNRDARLKAYTPQTIRFFVEYDPQLPIPQLKSFRVNARTVCPEGLDNPATTSAPKLQTSGVGNDSRPSGSVTRVTSIPIRQTTESSISNINSNEDCGTVVVQPALLITFAQGSQSGEYPWHVAIYHIKGINPKYQCGGSLITKNHVLTAGHCVIKEGTKIPLNNEDVFIYLGKYLLHSFSHVGIQDREVKEIHLNPSFNSQRIYANDIAIITLSAPAVITDYVRTICLWKGPTDLSSVVDKQGNVAGWGFDETGKLSQKLQQTKMPIVSQEVCLFSYLDFYSRFTSNTTFCAGFQNGTSVCNGDSGGGMVFPYRNPTTNKVHWHIRGLVSLTVPLENQIQCDPTKYVVFTDVAKFLPWIRSVISR